MITAYTEPTPQAIRLSEMHDGKPVIRYFVSYAHDDRNLKNQLLKLLKQQLAIANDYCFEAWDDAEILVGERWHDQIQEAVTRCQFGLLLVSPAFLGSNYIEDYEFSAFVTSNFTARKSEKRAIPVALKRIPFDNSMNLKGLKNQQVFHDRTGRAFQQCRDVNARYDFALELFQHILKIVKRYSPPRPTSILQSNFTQELEIIPSDTIKISPEPELIKELTMEQTISLKLEKTLEPPRREIWEVAITPEGYHLVTAFNDRKVRIWNVETGILLDTLTVHEDNVMSVSVSPDGSRVQRDHRIRPLGSGI